jgi:hypothetical protein
MEGGDLSRVGFRSACIGSSPFAINGLISDIGEKQKEFLNILWTFGYDEDLNLCYARGFVLSIHSEEIIKTISIPPTVDAASGMVTTHDMIHDEAIEQAVINFGEAMVQKNYILYKMKNGYTGASFVVKNTSTVEDLIITFKVTGNNVMSTTGKYF